MKSILLVEDDPDLQRLFVRAIEKRGYEVVAVPDGTSAIRELQSHRPLSLIVSNVFLSGALGIRPDLNVLLVADEPGSSVRNHDFSTERCYLLPKPFGIWEFLTHVVRLAGDFDMDYERLQPSP